MRKYIEVIDCAPETGRFEITREDFTETGNAPKINAAPAPEAQERQGNINPDRLRKSEILSLARLFHVSIGTATEYRDILAAQVKQSGVALK